MQFETNKDKQQITLHSVNPVVFLRLDLDVAEEIFNALDVAIQELRKNKE